MKPFSDDPKINTAYELGRDAGICAASSIFDGNTELKTYQRVLRGIEAGDPEIMDALPCPNLSGEWADDPTPQSLVRELTADEQDEEYIDELCLAWEQGAATGVQDEAERICHYQLGHESGV